VFADIDIRPSRGREGQNRLVFQDKWSPKTWYESHQVSDGSLFVLALLALKYQLAPPSLIAIEEPEHGLHPYLLSEIVELLRALSVDPIAPMQVLLATQSSELLDLLRPEEVRFLTRKADGSVDVRAADLGSDTWKEAYDAHQSSLASLWLSGTAGGVP
jgi:predicted ATPase